jgi:hypothetical protein
VQQMQSHFESEAGKRAQPWQWRPCDRERPQGTWLFANYIGERLEDCRR